MDVVESKGVERGLLTELWDHHPANLLAWINWRKIWPGGAYHCDLFLFVNWE